MAKPAKAAKTTRRKSTRADGRLSTILYIRPELLDEVQEVAKNHDLTAWRWIEGVIEKALKSERRK